jgi:ABC-type transporter Mla MlaB component
MAATFSISASSTEARLRIEGELDVVGRGPLAWRLLDLEQLECPNRYLDVGGVTHVDSASMRLIDEARLRILAGGAHFEIASASLSFALLAEVGGYAALAAGVRPRAASPGSRLVRGYRSLATT